MATSLTISTDVDETTLATTLSTENDVAAQNVLIRFAHATGAAMDMPAGEKLDHVAFELTQYMIRIARERYVLEETTVIQQDALDNVHW